MTKKDVNEWWDNLSLNQKFEVYNRNTLPYTDDNGIFHDVFGQHWSGNTQVNIDGSQYKPSNDLVNRMIKPLK